MKFAKGWRTIGFMVAVAVVGVLQQADWMQLVPPQYAGLALAVVGAAGMFLRMVTTTAPGSSS